MHVRHHNMCIGKSQATLRLATVYSTIRSSRNIGLRSLSVWRLTFRNVCFSLVPNSEIKSLVFCLNLLADRTVKIFGCSVPFFFFSAW